MYNFFYRQDVPENSNCYPNDVVQANFQRDRAINNNYRKLFWEILAIFRS